MTYTESKRSENLTDVLYAGTAQKKGTISRQGKTMMVWARSTNWEFPVDIRQEEVINCFR